MDPARGVNGYTAEEYQLLLARYTHGRVRFSTAAQNYRVLAQRALVAAQRYQGLPFIESVRLPLIVEPLYFFPHHVPGQEYTPFELQQFYVYYNVTSEAALRQVHLDAERRYGLDPSFVILGQWLRRSAPATLLRYLADLFQEPSISALLAHRYRNHQEEYDPDVLSTVVLQKPELLLEKN